MTASDKNSDEFELILNVIDSVANTESTKPLEFVPAHMNLAAAKYQCAMTSIKLVDRIKSQAPDQESFEYGLMVLVARLLLDNCCLSEHAYEQGYANESAKDSEQDPATNFEGIPGAHEKASVEAQAQLFLEKIRLLAKSGNSASGPSHGNPFQ